MGAGRGERACEGEAEVNKVKSASPQLHRLQLANHFFHQQL